MRRKSPLRPEQYAFYTNGDIAEVLLLLKHRSSRLAFIQHVLLSNSARNGYKFRATVSLPQYARRLMAQYGL